ncbi:GNAT family N-acetyltransferase [Streptomyces sp. P6-2-1]|uniref:GNAT family N-acetyltransferase n=1 Tax=Streptomyces sp. P6-2-1 TaxID=3422591 RepID=UPI003D36C275
MPTPAPPAILRPATPADSPSWLRCRVLSFLDSAYFDDVLRAKPATPHPGLDLVAVDAGGEVVGIMAASLDGGLATIDTVAVHPAHRRRGLAAALLTRVRAEARRLGAETLDAWTRDDPGTLAWYRAQGFTEGEHYLHVYADHYHDAAEPGRAVRPGRERLAPVKVFAHAPLSEEARLRAEFGRVHVCRRFRTSP